MPGCRGFGDAPTPRGAAPAARTCPELGRWTGQVADLPADAPTRMAGLLLTLPDLLALDLPALVTAAGYPGTGDIPAISYLLSLLALKLTGTRRVSHVARRRRRPCCGTVHRADRTAQDHRTDQLLLPPAARQTEGVPDRPRRGHHHRGPGHR